MKAWWGKGLSGESIVVARTATDAAKLVGIAKAEFPYRFEPTALDPLMGKSGVYQRVDGRWILEVKS